MLLFHRNGLKGRDYSVKTEGEIKLKYSLVEDQMKQMNKGKERGRVLMNKQAGHLGYRSEGVIHGWMGR